MSVLPKKILLATDGSEDAALATRAAVDLASRAGAELHIVRVFAADLPDAFYAPLPPEVLETNRREARERFEKDLELVRSLGGTVAQARLLEGRPTEAILELAEEMGAGLVVLGSRGLGPVRRLALGSVSEGVVHNAPCPVLVARGGERAWPPREVIVGEDDSEEARAAGALAAGVGGLFGATGILLRSYPSLPEVDAEARALNARTADDALRRAEKALVKRADELEGALGTRPRVLLAAGDPAVSLLEASGASASPLLAVGSRGLGAAKRLRLGSTSTKVLRAAYAPVLVCPPLQAGVRNGGS